MHTHEAGKPYRTGVPDSPSLRLTPNGCELILVTDTPASAEINELVTGELTFAWIESERVAVLCHRIGDRPWVKTPFEVHRQPEHERGPIAGGPDEPLHLAVLLVAATTGIVQAVRSVTWPAHFAHAVRTTVTRHLQMAPSEAASAAALQALCARYPDTAALVRDRADACC